MVKKSSKSKDKQVDTLHPGTRKWIASVKAEFVLSEHHDMVLELAGRAWDRACDAAQDIAVSGLTFVDRLGNLRPRPSCKIENESTIIFARMLRELALDVELPAALRPPTIRR